MKQIIKKYVLVFLEIILLPLTFISSLWFKFLRKNIVGLWQSNSIISKSILKYIGVFPINNQFYEPLFDTDDLKNLDKKRKLTGLEFKSEKYLNRLKDFNYNEELIKLQSTNPHKGYNFYEGSFLSGDAEILYSVVRYFRPNQIVEIGCGNSSRLIQFALNKNFEENKVKGLHTCIEPYAHDWLTNLDANVIREKVEDVDLEIFKKLKENDILFIDSSHMVRPQGDVLFEILSVLPILNKGVIIHVHDIFTPRDYLKEWLQDGTLFWNEQYLLEAFLSCNEKFEIEIPVNYLKNNYYNSLEKVCPFLERKREPGSFWFKKIG